MKSRQQRPWLEAVSLAKSAYTSQRWRLSAIDAIDGWKQVAISWYGCAVLREFGLAYSVPEELESVDDLLAWAWDVVHPAVSEALRICAAKSSIPDVLFVEAFTIMQSHGLVFPDGTVLDAVMRRIEVDINVRELRQSLRLHELGERVQEITNKKKAKP